MLLNKDNRTVTAQRPAYQQTLPLVLVDTNESVLYYERECGVNSSFEDVRIRWLQIYTSVPPQQDIPVWSIDNITVVKWEGHCKTIILHEDFESYPIG